MLHILLILKCFKADLIGIVIVIDFEASSFGLYRIISWLDLSGNLELSVICLFHYLLSSLCYLPPGFEFLMN